MPHGVCEVVVNPNDHVHHLAVLPMPMRWLNQPAAWEVVGRDMLVLTAGARTDLFSDPDGEHHYAGAPALLGHIDGDFMLSARVRLTPAAQYDAGVLLLYSHEHSWAKLCVEQSPQGELTIVSVVTRGLSDDCNSIPADGADTRLRISRLGSAYAFHASIRNGFWHLIRYFALEGEPEVGFLVQSPAGESCTARFEEIRWSPMRLPELRNGG
jgi:regulation of enolase protein 1 (concanavalin A-like superfamily)